jgi:signal transduction histidine kinase
MEIELISPIKPTMIATSADRFVAIMRFFLFVSGLLLLLIDPLDPADLTADSVVGLSLYATYSAILYLLIRRPGKHLLGIQRWSHWADVVWFTVLIFSGQGAFNIFFFGFFFAIMVGSFRWGFATGMWVTVVSVVMYVIASFVEDPVGINLLVNGPEPDLDNFLLRPLFMFVLGVMMAYWGGHELTLQRQLALLKEVTILSNPRFGVDRTIGWMMERVREFYNADSCLLIFADGNSEQYSLRHAQRGDTERAMAREYIPAALGELLLGVPPTYSLIYPPMRWQWNRQEVGYIQSVETIEAIPYRCTTNEQIAAALDAQSFLTVPFFYRNERPGRLYLTAQRRIFQATDIDFLHQIIGHVLPVIDNIRLVDRLASEAAEDERRRIARDLHDSVIQPYIGLQIGLGGLRQRFIANTVMVDDVERLIALTEAGIVELRDYAHGLTNSGEREGSLIPALHRFSRTFTEATGIMVDVQILSQFNINDRFAAEIFQIVAEGLSNIRRHTVSTCAIVRLRHTNDDVIVQIENTRVGSVAPFVPRSITERAMSLGGDVRVEQSNENNTVVIVEIPM